jgi:hypothetical protein
MISVMHLIKRAGMSIFDYNTRVVLPADATFRVHVTNGMTPFGDHVQIGICNEPGDPGAPWHYAHFSPARARVIAHHLIEVSERLEASQ